MYITTNASGNKKYFKTKEAAGRTQQKYLAQFNFSKTITNDNMKDISTKGNDSMNRFTTMDIDNNEDFLLSFWKRFDDIFKKLEGNEKIFEELKRKKKTHKTSELFKSAIYSRKLNFNKKKIVKHKKIDTKKIVEIQKIFKGHFIRKLNLNIDRLKLRQCLIELFCLLLLGHWCHSQIRYNFFLLKTYYITAKLYAGEELSFIDRISLKLPSCFYNKAKINDLNSNKLGEDLQFN